MPDAILQCTEAAGAEFEATLQKSLLRVRQLVVWDQYSTAIICIDSSTSNTVACQ